jgi:hypothetical protein
MQKLKKIPWEGEFTFISSFVFIFFFMSHDYRKDSKEKFVRRHGGARRILSLELLGFMNLLSPASLYSRVNR